MIAFQRTLGVTSKQLGAGDTNIRRDVLLALSDIGWMGALRAVRVCAAVPAFVLVLAVSTSCQTARTPPPAAETGPDSAAAERDGPAERTDPPTSADAPGSPDISDVVLEAGGSSADRAPDGAGPSQCGSGSAPCVQDGDCCGRQCQAGRCCEPKQGDCSSSADCCGGTCLSGGLGQRVCCGGKGARCTFGDECCSGGCQRISALASACGCFSAGQPCRASPDCCQGSCRNGQCVCAARRESCRFGIECCSNICKDGSCL